MRHCPFLENGLFVAADVSIAANSWRGAGPWRHPIDAWPMNALCWSLVDRFSMMCPFCNRVRHIRTAKTSWTSQTATLTWLDAYALASNYALDSDITWHFLLPNTTEGQESWLGTSWPCTALSHTSPVKIEPSPRYPDPGERTDWGRVTRDEETLAW
jgi:hypothetical protein